MSDGPSWRDPRHPEGDRLALLQRAGHHFLLGLFSLLRTAAIHDLNNRALDRPVAQTLEGLAPFVQRAQGRFSVVALEGQLYIDDIRIRVPGASYHLVGELETVFADRGVGGLSFEGLPRPGQLRRFAHVFQHHLRITGGESGRGLEAALDGAGVGAIRVAQRVRAHLEGEEATTTESTSRVDTTITYAKAVSALSQLLADPSGRSQLRRRHINRVVREIAGCASETLDYLIGLTEFSANRHDRARLCVDSCVVAIALARAMKLPRPLIADLGVAAMAGCEEAGDGEATSPKPAITALKDLIHASRWSPALLRRTLVAAQRSQPVRGSGGMPDQHRLARILRVARDYVALTHGMAPDTLAEREELTPLEALSFLSQSPPSVYDPLVIAHLVRVVGMYPMGTLVRLSDGREAFVVGRDTEGEPVLLLREGPHCFGERVPLVELGAAVVGVATSVDADERAAAVLGDIEQRTVQQKGEDIARGSTLARVAIRRVAVKKGPETSGS